MKKAIIFPKGTGIPYCVNVPEDITCEWIARNIGCEWVEIVRPRRLPRGIVMVCDEEGLMKENELNHVASWFYETDKHGSPIVGDVMILKEEMGPEGPEFAGMTNDDVNKVFGLIGRRDENV